MSLELICGTCGRRWPIDGSTSVTTCPECSGILQKLPSDIVRREDAPPSVQGLPVARSVAPESPLPPGAAWVPAAPPPAPKPSPVHQPVQATATVRSVQSLASNPNLRGPSPLVFKLVISYASAMTLACLYLLYLLFHWSPTLDLPDLVPPKNPPNRVTTLLHVPPESIVPPAHRLALGQSRRYGSLVVTPLRITRGPLEFAFFNPAANESRPPSKPVLKLHLKLDNVSAEQTFAALDRQLVYTKEPDPKDIGWFKANNFLCAVKERTEYRQHVLVYDLSPESEWLVQDANLDHELKPGESVVSFIPTTEEGWDDLSGELVWRIHLRKGYNPQSSRGVTTLIEVHFQSGDVRDDSACDQDDCFIPAVDAFRASTLVTADTHLRFHFLSPTETT